MRKVDKEIENAAEFAMSSPMPDDSESMSDIYYEEKRRGSYE